MGWFWADPVPSSAPGAPHPIPHGNATPPPGCPMHKPSSSSSRPTPPSAITASAPPSSPPASNSTAPGACPYVPPDSTPSSKPNTSPPERSYKESSTLSKLNPLNYMPTNLSQSRAANQTVHLPTERERSTIPRGDEEGTWEYPSPQQMYNAMLRKGYTDTPQDAVESMVAVHNFLNEGAWAEIMEWERRFSRGLGQGWQECRRGEEAAAEMAERAGWPRNVPEPRLLRFMGRPGDMTPKAKMFQMLGYVAPGTFGGEPPFDRHDWFVQRFTPDGGRREVRYVIDYYSGPPEPTGEPVFYLDVRPAVDSPTAAVERVMRWGGDVWWRASGGSVREAVAESRNQR